MVTKNANETDKNTEIVHSVEKPLSFAERILKKQGWNSGEGLGKNAQGISEPIKASLKFDKTGVGHDPAKEFTSTWWADAYKNAADNVTIGNDEDGTVKINWNKNSKDEKKASKRSFINSQYTAFVQSSTLDGGKLIDTGESSTDTKQHEEQSASVGKEPLRLTDEELFLACGGLTAHKGARHGHKMSGKQKRLEMQEKELMMKMQKTYKLVPDDSGEKVMPFKVNNAKMPENVSNEDELKKRKHKKEKKERKKEKAEKKKLKTELIHDNIETVFNVVEPIECKENARVEKRKRKKEKRPKSDTDLTTKCDNESNTNEIVISQKTKKPKKKRKFEKSNEDVDCDKL